MACEDCKGEVKEQVRREKRTDCKLLLLPHNKCNHDRYRGISATGDDCTRPYCRLYIPSGVVKESLGDATGTTENDEISAEITDVQALIIKQCKAVSDILISKNEAYGNSALDPVRVFSKAPTDEQLNVRIDDKLSRLMRGDNAGEDVILDLIGYLILKRVWRDLDG